MIRFRSQAGCIPVRLRRGQVQVLLVTSRYTGQWLAPKGTIDPGETPDFTAARETWEEAGVYGHILDFLGYFDYPRGPEVGRVEVFALQVTGQTPSWDEQKARNRKWFSLDAALEKVQRAEVLEMLLTLKEALDAQKIHLTE